MSLSQRLQHGVRCFLDSLSTSLLNTICAGHAKPMCALAARIVRARPITVTLLTPGIFFTRMEKELARQFGDHETDYHGRVRSVQTAFSFLRSTTQYSDDTRLIGLANHEQNLLDSEVLSASFAKAYLDLVEERPLTCYKSEKEFASLPSPDVVIVDVGPVCMLKGSLLTANRCLATT